MNTHIGSNALWNVLGATIPLFAGIIAIPLLLRSLGDARLGVFTLALGLIGFSGLFDLGLGRALTHMVAFEQGKGTSHRAIAGLARKALSALVFLGLIWAIILWWITPFITEHLFFLSGVLGKETTSGLHWIALSLPFALPAAGLIGILEGLQQFPLINTIRMPLGAAFFIIPALVGLVMPDVGIVIGALAATRMVAFLIWMFTLLRVFNLFTASPPAKLRAGPLIRFSGWLTVSNIVGPLMVYTDRFYLASLFSPATLALYTVPLDTAFRLTSLPLAAINALFPALAHARSQPAQAAPLVRLAGQFMLLLWFPPILVAILLAQESLTLWLNQGFASQATSILQWILLGIFLNGFAHIPYAVLQAAGHADTTAKLHMLELPFYAGLIAGLVTSFGIVGAAMAWAARIFLDTILLFLLAIKIERHHTKELCSALLFAGFGLSILTIAMLIHSLSIRWTIAAVVIFATISIIWHSKAYLAVRLRENTGDAR